MGTIDLLNTDAMKVVSRLEALAAYDRTDSELGYSFIFPELELALWRPVLPESPKDKEGHYFDSVGIGVKGYFSGRRA